MISQERLGGLLDYSPDTGIFTWRQSGELAGCEARRGNMTYIVIRVLGTLYYAHRLAIFYMDGYWPTYVDHENGDGTDNRYFHNLRVTSNRGNALGFSAKDEDRGLYLEDGKWYGMVWFHNNRVKTPKFDTKEEAQSGVAELRTMLMRYS